MFALILCEFLSPSSPLRLSRLYTYHEIHENNCKCEKQKVFSGIFCVMFSGIFCVTFFVYSAPFFTFRISLQGWHSCEKLKDFVVYFFTVLIKHEICMKYEKCMVNVSYFVVYFTKTFAKYAQTYPFPLLPLLQQKHKSWIYWQIFNILAP